METKDKTKEQLIKMIANMRLDMKLIKYGCRNINCVNNDYDRCGKPYCVLTKCEKGG